MNFLPEILRSRRFLPLFITQFLGAFNDNLFKNALVILITYQASRQLQAEAQILITIAAGLFMLPYLLFSALAGQIADKYDRASIARYTKILEILLMTLAAIGLVMNSIIFLLFVLFCMGTQSTFFGPVKYALLPQHLKENELLAGNAYVEAATFLAILLGTIAGGLLILNSNGMWLIITASLACAILGYMSSRYIPAAPSNLPTLKINWNIVQETWRIIQHDRQNPRVYGSILAISWFWLVGATFLSQFPTFAKQVLHGDETVVTMLLVAFSVGIGMGSLLCNWLLKGQVKTIYAPYAGIALSLFAFDLFWACNQLVFTQNTAMNIAEFLTYGSHWRIVIDLTLIAVSGGVFVVPLYAVMQHDSDPDNRARTIASNNVINALFMVAAALLTVWMLKASFTVLQVFLAVAIANIPAALLTIRLRASQTR